MNKQPNHHISDELLLAYAAGSLAEAQSLIAACHIASCPDCRAKLKAADSLGGALLDNLPPEPVSPGSLEALFARLDAPAAQDKPATSPIRLVQTIPGVPEVTAPAPLAQYLGALRWQRLGPGVQSYVLPTSGGASARLMRLAPGVRLPSHRHRGLELTMVLAGGYHDGLAHYGPGDISELDEAHHHQPVVDRDGECIALAVTEKLALYDRFVYRLIQPLIGL